MNTSDSNPLIDEDEIKAAIRCFDLDRESFNRGVREQVELGIHDQSSVTRGNPLKYDSGHAPEGLLRVAASVVPFQLLGGNGSVAQSTATAIGGGKKAFALISIPAMSLLMIMVTIGSLIRIRKAQANRNDTDSDVMQAQQTINAWWRKHGWVAAIVFVIALAAPMLGWTSALLVVFIVSSLATASLVVALGKAGLVNRRAVASYSIPVLGLLGQISLGFGMTNHTSLLDPKLVSVTCFAGVGILALFIRPYAEEEGKTWLGPVWHITLPLICVVLILFGTKTIWKPITTASMVQYVESFDTGLVGRWKTWAVTAEWLDDQNIEFDRAGVRHRFLETFDAQEHKRYLYGIGVSTGLIRPSELIEDKDVVANRERLLDEPTIDQQITSIGQIAFVIEASADAGNLSQTQCDHLEARLMVTWNKLKDDALVDAQVITRMLVKLNRSPAFSKRQTDVLHWLNKYQVTTPMTFSPLGGFQRYSSIQASDPTATDAAVRLMKHYGVSQGVDVLALRSYLQPEMDFGLLTDIEMMKASTLARLNQVPGILQPTAWDYFVRDQSLWFAIVLVGLCLYATLGSPASNAHSSLKRSADPSTG